MRRVLETHERAASKTPETGLIQRLGRQSAFLSKRFESIGVDVAPEALATAILHAPSSEQGVKDSVARLGIDTAELGEILNADPTTTPVVQHLEKTRRKIIRGFGEVGDCIARSEAALADLERLVTRYDKRISYQITSDRLLHFFEASTPVLMTLKKFVSAGAAIARSGRSLFGH